MSNRMPTKNVNDFSYRRFERETQYSPMQFKQKEPTIPYKSIITAVALFVVGSVLIIVAALLFTGHINAQYSDRMWPVFIIGVIMFIPGFYHVRIAYYAWCQYEGYSFEDLPDDN